VFALFFLAEYANMILMCSLIVILFFGGWLAFIPFIYIPSYINFSIKVLFFMFLFIWVRGSLPRYRYDQLMSLGWKCILPISLVSLIYSIGLILLFI
jgi:NADH-quinone oxidoreductase subunit H